MVPKLKAPIVLVHGLYGFNQWKLAGLTLATYFPGVAECLEAGGNRLLIPSLHPTGGVSHRAQEFKDYLLANSPDEPVHILAHSMGGLDARYMISKLGMADHVLSLTTLGTPHHGSAMADLFVGEAPPGMGLIGNGMAAICRCFERWVFGIPHQQRAVFDLTRSSCRKFNVDVPPAPNVHYYSVAATLGRGPMPIELALTPEWMPSYCWVYNGEGDNDGVVSVESAKYGDGFEIWQGDHFSLVNWFHPWAKNRTFFRDPERRYGRLIRRLADRGF